jgi:hypothetical protein
MEKNNHEQEQTNTNKQTNKSALLEENKTRDYKELQAIEGNRDIVW